MKLKRSMIVAGASLALLVVPLAGCSKSEAKPAPAATQAPAAPAATAAPAAKTISGRISYEGSTKPTHQIIIVAMKQGDQAPTYSAVLRQPGTFTIGSVADGTYQVTAFMDLGDDMGAPKPNEPSGAFDTNGDGKPDEVIIKDSKGLAGIDITLRDPK